MHGSACSSAAWGSSGAFAPLLFPGRVLSGSQCTFSHESGPAQWHDSGAAASYRRGPSRGWTGGATSGFKVRTSTEVAMGLAAVRMRPLHVSTVRSAERIWAFVRVSALRLQSQGGRGRGGAHPRGRFSEEEDAI